MSDQLEQEILNRIAMERQNIASSEDRLNQMANKPKQMDLSPLLGFIDSTTGSGLSRSYARPQDNSLQIEQLKQNLGRQRMGVTDDELNMLRILDQRKQANQKVKAAEKIADKKESSGELELTPGQKEVDKKFAKEYTDWSGSGGYTQIKNNLGLLNKAKGRLDKKDSLGGRVMPKGLRSLYDGDAIMVQDQVEKVAQQSMRQILGSQFTEKEGKLILERSYNPKLSDKENMVKIDEVMTEIDSLGKAKQEAVDYFSKHGTLKGFKGGDFSDMGSFEKTLKNKFNDKLGKEDSKSELDKLSEELGL